MSLAFGIAIYIVCWWTILFAVLPIGVRTQSEEGEVIPGTIESAPAQPKLLYKFLLTTVISTFVFLIIYIVMAYDYVKLDDIPFLPRYEPS